MDSFFFFFIFFCEFLLQISGEFSFDLETCRFYKKSHFNSQWSRFFTYFWIKKQISRKVSIVKQQNSYLFKAPRSGKDNFDLKTIQLFISPKKNTWNLFFISSLCFQMKTQSNNHNPTEHNDHCSIQFNSWTVDQQSNKMKLFDYWKQENSTPKTYRTH